MRRNIENIEIQDPPIEELKKKSSCLKSTCFTGFGCIVIFLIGSFFLLKYSAGPRTQTLKTAPENFPESIPIYDKDSIETITLTPGGEASRVRDAAAYASKIVLAPILMTVENKGNKNLSEILTWQNFKDYLKKNPPEHRDSVEIVWKDLVAGPRFVANYYQTELKKHDYVININNADEHNFQFTFNLDNIDGEFSLSDDTGKKGTDEVRLTIKFPKP